MAEPEIQLGPRGGLLQKPAAPAPDGAPVAAPPQEGGGLEIGPRGGITTQREAEPVPDYGRDIGKSALAGLGRGAVGLTGLPGDIESLVDFAREKISGTKPGERYFPTSAEMISKAEALHPTVKETLGYAPQTTAGKYIKSGAEFVPGALIGPGGLGAKVAGGIGAGLAVQGAEDVSKAAELSPTAEAALKFGVSIPAYMAGAKGASLVAKPFTGLVSPGGVAKEQLASSLAKDIASGGKYGAPAEAASALASGAEMAPAALAGARTKDVLGKAAARASDDALKSYETAAATAAENAPKNTISHIDNLFGAPVDAFDEMQALARRMRDVNSENYQRVMALPEVQAIGGPQYDAIIKRVPQRLMNKVAEDMRMSGIMPEDLGMIAGKGGYTINPAGMPLRFWDELKKGLDSQMSGLKDVSGKITDPSRFSGLNSLNSDLKAQLNKVDAYKAIRDEAAEMFGARDWTELGQKYFTMTDRNMGKVKDLETRLAKASDERKMDFAYGLASSYKDLLNTNPDKALALFSGKTGQFNVNKFINGLAPLGDNAGVDLIGRANAEYLNRNIAAIKPTFGSQVKSQYLPIVGGAAGGLVDLLMQPFIWSGSPSAIITTVAGMGLGKLYSMKEARIAGKVLEYASDPAMTAELGRLIAKDPAARSFLAKTNSVLSRGVKYPAGVGTISAGEQAAQPQQEPTQTTRATGGRVGRATGGRTNGMMTAEMLMQAAHAAKKKINKTTEEILNAPDEAVVKALSVAKQHI